MAGYIKKDYLENSFKDFDKDYLIKQYEHKIIELTYEEYNALSDEYKKDKTFLITDIDDIPMSI